MCFKDKVSASALCKFQDRPPALKLGKVWNELQGGKAAVQQEPVVQCRYKTTVCVFLVTYEICGLLPASSGSHGISRAHRMISSDLWPNFGGWEVG